MTKKKIHRLVQRIAEEINEIEDAHYIVESLIKIKDWEMQIKKAQAYRTQRERKRVYSANARAKSLKLPGTLTPDDWFETLKHFKWKCAYCQEDFSYEHLEHFIPLVKNQEGTTAQNCVPACKACNSHKNTKDMDDWLKQPNLETLEDPLLGQLKRVQRYLQSRDKPTPPTERQIRLPKPRRKSTRSSRR
jgi:5-methylcytosine-specific restriction endonuclease McrA